MITEHDKPESSTEAAGQNERVVYAQSNKGVKYNIDTFKQNATFSCLVCHRLFHAPQIQQVARMQRSVIRETMRSHNIPDSVAHYPGYNT